MPAAKRGKVSLGGIGKKTGNVRLRATLIQGAMAFIRTVKKREPRNGNEQWLQSLVNRRGVKRAAVALVNKTICTAWSMLSHNTSYQAAESFV
jgi:transposase